MSKEDFKVILDKVNTSIVRIECLTRANWHDKEEMISSRKELREQCELLQSYINEVRTAVGCETVKAI